MVNNIQYVGLKDFNEKEQKDIIEYSEKYNKRIERDLKGGVLRILAKKHNKTGNRCKYSFHAQIQSPTILINVKDDDWELHKALNKVLKKVENNIKHKFKTEK